ncbi:hypothetical protein ACFSUS_01365 [Spirosoma soli]|uniref:DUF2490 domain-containing protein n=1 Tax=Spirosoma soli TaxID=1770529 RepID=A0ABW5LZ02_9BACT
MKRFIFFLLAIRYTAFGQTPNTTANPVDLAPKSDFRYSLFTELGVTVASTSVPIIRSFFRNNQIKPDVHIDPMLNLGFGTRYARFKAMLQAGYGINLIYPFNQEATAIARQTDARYGGMMVGYDVANARNRRLYINAGLGNISYEYSIYRRTNQVVTFQDVLQSNQSGTIPSLQLRNTYLDLNLEYTQREKRKQGAETVLRLGYRRAVHAKAWESDAFQITDAPTDRISQFYIQGTYYFSSNYTKSSKR